MPELDDLIKSSTATGAPIGPLTAGVVVLPSATQQSNQTSEPSVTQSVNTNENTVNAYINCETNASLMVYNQNDNQLFNTLIEQNSYKTSGNSLTIGQPTELTFSDLTPPVPNVSILESNRMISVDTSLPTVDGVSGAVPEPKSVLIQQLSSLPTEPPSIEIPSNEQLITPKDSTLLVNVAESQYSNIFQPVINGPSGSAPQTPAASPIDSIETNLNSSITLTNNNETTLLPPLSTYDTNNASFANSAVDNNVFSQMVPVLANSINANVSAAATDGPLPALGIEPALQEQLLDAIPPPSTNFPPGPVPTDESGLPSALPGEFPLSLLPVEEEKVGGIESASVSLDKIEATINMNAKPVPTLTNNISLIQSDVNLINSLPQTPQSNRTLEETTSANIGSIGSNHLEISAQHQQQFNLNYNCQTNASELVYSSVGTDVQQSQTPSAQLPPHQQPPQEQQTSPTLQSIQQTLQHQQQSLEAEPETIVPDVNISSSQLSGVSAPQNASIGVYESNDLMPELTQSQLSSVLPPPPPLQPVHSVNQSNIAPIQEMTLTNLVPVVESPSQLACRQPISVVIKSEPQSYTESIGDNENTINMSKVNDDNNNPIMNSLSRNKDHNTRNTGLVNNNSVRGFPLCVISTTPTFMSKNNPTITPKYELTLPPKKAKFNTSLASVTQSLSSKTSSQAVPSTGMIYDLQSPQQHSDSPITPSTFRVQSGLNQTPRIQHNISPPFTTVSPILFSGLMPSGVSVAIDGPLSLVKEEKMRQLITTTSIANHPDYPAISGLLSFINPYHSKSMTTSSSTPSSEVVSETPLSLSIKNTMTQTPITSITMNPLATGQPSYVVPSLSRPSLHQNQQNITSATTIVHTPPTAVPVSVVTSVVDHNRGLSQRIKNVGQNNTKSKVNDEHNTTGSTASSYKLQLAPLLSGDPAKPFQCALCGKHLASKNVYQLHLRSHSGEKPFQCNLCGHSFSQKTSLTRHMRSHTGERPFPCQVCGKRFADKERIKIHMRTHTGEKPFACDVCGKQFSQKSTVKRHMSVHTGEKPFKCETCGKGFANRGNLTAHTKTHSNS